MAFIKCFLLTSLLGVYRLLSRKNTTLHSARSQILRSDCKRQFSNTCQQPCYKDSLRTEHDSISPRCECTSSGQLNLIILHGEMQSDPKTSKSLFYHFNFTSALFCRWKRPLLWMKEQFKFCSQACASAEVTVRVTAAVMNFNMEIIWTSPHCSKNWLRLSCISHRLVSGIR